MQGMIDNLTLGLQTAVSLDNLFWCFVGVSLGTLIGVIPGIGTLAAIAMLLPLTFHLEPTAALIMLAGIWYGTSYGGNTAAILLNVPGTPASAVTCLDGYPMARNGRAGVALFMSTIASFVGGSIGILVMIFLAPILVRYALAFGSAEYFSLMLLGLIAACTISETRLAKGLIMVALGILIGTVGTDIYTGELRFTFGNLDLFDGISIVALTMGIFGVSEVIGSIRRLKTEKRRRVDVALKSMLPTSDEARRSAGPILRGSAFGSFVGVLPGTGVSIASFMAYATEKRLSRNPERFGKGAIEGVVAPESANNAADQTAFIPTLTLGIPGGATMALMIGALLIHGIAPGPNLMATQPSLFWGLVMSFWIGNLLLLLLNIPLIGVWVRLILVPYHFLFPVILVFICIGVYSVNYSSFEIWLVMALGVGAYILNNFGYPPAPLLLGFVLGPMMEENFRRAMLLSDGDFSTFVSRPISAVVLSLCALLVSVNVYQGIRKNRERLREQHE